MARIRTIKPDFFLDEGVAELPMEARLGFIGLWTQADKEGKLENRPKMLKAVIFPYDRVDFEKALLKLSEAGLITLYAVEGKNYIKIKGFEKHQRPHHSEPESIIPSDGGHSPSDGGHSPSDGGHSPSDGGKKSQEGKGKERKGREGREESEEFAGKPALPSPKDFFNAWNEQAFTTPIPRAKELTKERQIKIRQRLTERTLDEWKKVFALISQSEFCRGNNDRGWKASLDWIIANGNNAAKALEGKYANKEINAPLGDTAKAQKKAAMEKFCEERKKQLAAEKEQNEHGK